MRFDVGIDFGEGIGIDVDSTALTWNSGLTWHGRRISGSTLALNGSIGRYLSEEEMERKRVAY
ncbi:hypothetical protein ANCCEY_11382 [Ancylostoma ceylanicum]|nr:hypothetical protein ANCCEY_11382 [Ancylostoma ceylanicum]